jgi:hypothetical protein
MTINEQLHNSATHAKGFDPACPTCREASPLRARLHDNEQRKAEAIAQFPETFHLAAYDGVFRISPSASYVNDAGVVMLYTQIFINGKWSDFCKGTQPWT